MAYALVLSDSLYRAFHAFRHGHSGDTSVVERLLHLYKPPVLSNVAQLKRIGIDDASLLAGLASAGFVDQALPDLCRRTFYKLILDTGRSDYPFVDINGDSLRNNYTITHKTGEKRTKIRMYLPALLSEASWVIVHDPYAVSNWKSTADFFQEFFPRKPLSIHFTTKIPGNRIKELKTMCPQWKMPINEKIRVQYQGRHDRYLVIDGQMEIILTSGIDYLLDDEKECTVIIRKLGDDLLT